MTYFLIFTISITLNLITQILTNIEIDYSWANMNVIIMYTCIKYYNFILKSRGCDFTTKYINLKAEIFNLRS